MRQSERRKGTRETKRDTPACLGGLGIEIENLQSQPVDRRGERGRGSVKRQGKEESQERKTKQRTGTGEEGWREVMLTSGDSPFSGF